MRLKITKPIITALFLAWAIPCLGAAPNAFQFFKDVERSRSDSGEQNILAITFDSDIYAVVNENASNFRIFDQKGQEVAYRLEKLDQKVDYPIVRFRVEQDPQQKITVVYVQAHREPLTQLTIETTSRNFRREATVEKVAKQSDLIKPDTPSNWVTIDTNDIELIDFRDIHRENLTITFAEQREEFYRIVIRNNDNAPLAITGVNARGNVYRAVFLADANESYRVGFGLTGQIRQPIYDIAAVQAALRAGHIPAPTTLGPLVINRPVSVPSISVPSADGPSMNAPPINVPAVNLRAIQPSNPLHSVNPANLMNPIGRDSYQPLLINPFLLGMLVVLLLAALVWILFRSTRRIG